MDDVPLLFYQVKQLLATVAAHMGLQICMVTFLTKRKKLVGALALADLFW